MSAQDHEKTQALLGAYAVNALTTDEWLYVDAHLSSCEICRAEADELVETASIIGSGVAPTVPEWKDVRDKIIGPSISELPPVKNPSRRNDFSRGVFAIAASLLVLVGAFVGAGIANMPSNKSDQTAAPAMFDSFDDDARIATLASPSSNVVVEIKMANDGHGAIKADSLPPLSQDRTYQLWAVVDGKTISVAVLGPDPSVAPFTMQGSVSAFALTEEAANGVSVSSNPPVVSGALSA